MLETIRSHEGQLALLPPQAFADRMNNHWTHKLSLCPSSALWTLWKVMGTTFQTAIVETAKGIQSPWRILQPPTGSGKTQGACVYAAMQADLNRDTENVRKPVSILIVTRRIEQADELATIINNIAGREVAVAHHSKKRATKAELENSDVLVITHQAYVNSSQSLKGHRDARWRRLVSWRGGSRLLTIIDEALANAIEENKVTTSSLSQVIGYIPLEVRQSCSPQVAALEQLHMVLLNFVAIPDEGDDASCIVWDEHNAPHSIDMEPLRAVMKTLPYDRLVLNQDNADERLRIARRVDEVLAAAEAIVDQFAYYAQQGKEHSLNSSALLIPLGTPGPVVLDATARANFLWDLLEDRAAVIPVPNHVRDYGNVTLHVARARGLGKHSMIKHIDTRWPRLLEAIEAELTPGRSVLVCMHKDTEHKALSYKNHFAKFAVAHWGAVDGRNDWADYDTGVIFGLPYRDRI